MMPCKKVVDKRAPGVALIVINEVANETLLISTNAARRRRPPPRGHMMACAGPCTPSRDLGPRPVTRWSTKPSAEALEPHLRLHPPIDAATARNEAVKEI